MSLRERLITFLIATLAVAALATPAALLWPAPAGQALAVLAIIASVGWLTTSFLAFAEVLSAFMAPNDAAGLGPAGRVHPSAGGRGPGRRAA